MSYNEFEIFYQFDEEDSQIFGDKFVDNNTNKCKIKYKEKEYELTGYFNEIDEEYETQEIISIKLKIDKDITDISYMFSECSSLI